MGLKICFGPVVDGNIDPDRCHDRRAKRYEKTVADEDGEDMPIVKYALKDGETQSGYTVTDLNQSEAEELAERLRSRAEAVHHETTLVAVVDWNEEDDGPWSIE